MSRRSLSLQNILWLTISTLTIVIALLVGQEVTARWRQLKEIEALKDATLFSDKLFDAIDELSVERDIAFAMLHAPGNSDMAELSGRLAESRRQADIAFDAVLASVGRYRFPELGEWRTAVEKYLADIRTMRRQIDQALALPKDQRNQLADQWYDKVTELNNQTQELWTQFIRHFTGINPVVTQHLIYKHFLLIIGDYIGRERALIGKLLIENADPAPEEIGHLLRWQGMIDLSWRMTRVLAEQSGLYAEIGPAYKDAESHYQTMYDMVRDIFYVPGAGHGTAYPISTDLWFELSNQAADSLDVLKEVSKKAKHAYLERLEIEGKQAIELYMGLLLFTLMACAYCFWVIRRRVIRPINAMVAALVDTMQGKPASFTPSGATSDEIGKLEQVLHAFQKNVEQIKRAALEKEKLIYYLKRSNQELDDFAYIASHDLKEPLRGLYNHASFLIEDFEDKLGEDGKRRLHRLATLAKRMERLVNDLLYFSRLGRTDMAVQEIDPNEMIDEIRQMLESFLKERHAVILVPKPLPHVVCDKPRITEVFRNLITNAVKYNDKPERRVEIGYLEQAGTPQGMERDVFYVRDNGLGIAPEFHQEIFRIFKRLQRDAEGAESGTGVGLTFVKKIIERHGGRIWLESEPGKGTSFYFTIKSPTQPD